MRNFMKSTTYRKINSQQFINWNRKDHALAITPTSIYKKNHSDKIVPDTI